MVLFTKMLSPGNKVGCMESVGTRKVAKAVVCNKNRITIRIAIQVNKAKIRFQYCFFFKIKILYYLRDKEFIIYLISAEYFCKEMSLYLENTFTDTIAFFSFK